MFLRVFDGTLVNLAAVRRIRPAPSGVELVFDDDDGYVLDGDPEALLDALATITAARRVADYVSEGSTDGTGDAGPDDRPGGHRKDQQMAQGTQDPMTARAAGKAHELDPSTASPDRAAAQVADSGWPKPGDEGYVHPDGTPQSVAQLADNRRAAADRAAAGSIVHGAPAVQRGGRPDATNMAVDRARAASGRTNDERDEALTKFIREGQDENTERTAAAAAVDSGADDSARTETVTPTAGPGGAPLPRTGSRPASRSGSSSGSSS